MGNDVPLWSFQADDWYGFEEPPLPRDETPIRSFSVAPSEGGLEPYNSNGARSPPNVSHQPADSQLLSALDATEPERQWSPMFDDDEWVGFGGVRDNSNSSDHSQSSHEDSGHDSNRAVGRNGTKGANIIPPQSTPSSSSSSSSNPMGEWSPPPPEWTEFEQGTDTYDVVVEDAVAVPHGPMPVKIEGMSTIVDDGMQPEPTTAENSDSDSNSLVSKTGEKSSINQLYSPTLPVNEFATNDDPQTLLPFVWIPTSTTLLQPTVDPSFQNNESHRGVGAGTVKVGGQNTSYRFHALFAPTVSNLSEHSANADRSASSVVSANDEDSILKKDHLGLRLSLDALTADALSFAAALRNSLVAEELTPKKKRTGRREKIIPGHHHTHTNQRLEQQEVVPLEAFESTDICFEAVPEPCTTNDLSGSSDLDSEVEFFRSISVDSSSQGKNSKDFPTRKRAKPKPQSVAYDVRGSEIVKQIPTSASGSTSRSPPKSKHELNTKMEECDTDLVVDGIEIGNDGSVKLVSSGDMLDHEPLGRVTSPVAARTASPNPAASPLPKRPMEGRLTPILKKTSAFGDDGTRIPATPKPEPPIIIQDPTPPTTDATPPKVKLVGRFVRRLAPWRKTKSRAQSKDNNKEQESSDAHLVHHPAPKKVTLCLPLEEGRSGGLLIRHTRTSSLSSASSASLDSSDSFTENSEGTAAAAAIGKTIERSGTLCPQGCCATEYPSFFSVDELSIMSSDSAKTSESGLTSAGGGEKVLLWHWMKTL
ncbi:hypothetical protein ACA910_005348 [Epithemia clementina (nom. ined.)]